MKCLILAAGYATRLYPLTENFPKPLLEVAGKSILDWLIEDLDATGLIEEYIVVTNHRFSSIFDEWAVGRSVATENRATLGNVRGRGPAEGWEGSNEVRRFQSDTTSNHTPIRIIDDGTSTNETRLGAVRDLELGIKTCGIDDDLLVMAGDNLLTFSLAEFLDYFAAKKTSCIMRFYQPDLERLHKSGVAEVDDSDRIVSMEEKPAQPKSHWCCPPFYIIRREDLPLVGEAIAAGCGTDAPGSFIAWLSSRTAVHAWKMPGERYDIGNPESYEKVRRIFEKHI